MIVILLFTTVTLIFFTSQEILVLNITVNLTSKICIPDTYLENNKTKFICKSN